MGRDPPAHLNMPSGVSCEEMRPRELCKELSLKLLNRRCSVAVAEETQLLERGTRALIFQAERIGAKHGRSAIRITRFTDGRWC